MELSTFIGLFAGIGSIGVGMALKGADPHSLINPAAFLIIFAGTFASLFNAFPMKDLKKMFVLFGILFKGKHFMEKQEILEFFVKTSEAAKKEGVRALERIASESTDPFIKSSLSLVADGFNEEFIVDVLDTEIRQMQERHRAGALIFSQGGMYAPTLGVLGAVIGLIAALGNLSDIDQLGHSIAAAFVATLLGIFTGYVCWHPFATKLKQFDEEEVSVKRMISEGILALQSGQSSIGIEAKLQAFIQPTKRKILKEEE